MSWLPHFTIVQYLSYAALALFLLGLGLTLVFGVMRGMLWLLSLSGRLLSRLWAWLWRVPLTSHGSSHLASALEVERAGFYQHPEHLPLAQFEGRTLYEPVGGSVALMAPPRSHKSWGVLMPCIKHFHGSVIVHDPRSELFEHTHTERESHGPVIRFDPANKMSAAIDPLHLIRWQEDQQHGDLQRVSLALLAPEPGQVMSEYGLEAVPLLTALLLERHEAGVAGLGAIVRLLVEPTTTLAAKFKALLAHPHPTVAQAARRMVDKSEARQAAIVQHLLASLNVFSDPLVEANTSANDLDLMEMQHGAQPVTLYWCSEFSEARRLRPLFGCLLEMLLARFGSPGEKRHKVLLALDEAMALGYSPELESGMSHLAGDGIQVLLAFQNRRQALRTYGEFSPLLDSIPTSMYFTPVHTDLVTRQEISDMLGTTTGEYATRSQRLSAWGLFQSETRGSQRLARPLMTSDEVAQMDEESAIVVTKAHPPILARKLDAAPLPVLTLPQRYQRPAIAASVAALLMLGLWTVGQRSGVWTNLPSPAPSLSQPGQVSQGEAGMTRDLSTPPPDDMPAPGLTTMERYAYVRPEPKRWQLLHEVSPAPFGGKGPWSQPETFNGHFSTEAECQQALTQKLAGLHQVIAQQPPGQVYMQRLENGYTQTLGTKTRKETWRCAFDTSEQPS